MTNKELIDYWISSSDIDYNAMTNLYNTKNYTWCLFIGHLVIEKLLKAVYVKNNEDNPYPPKIHNLISIAKKSNIELDKNKNQILGVINTFNISARYDDYKKEFYNKCTFEYTKIQIKNIEEMREWLKKLLI